MKTPEPRLRAWSTFAEAWWGPSPSGTVSAPVVPDRPVDRVALALQASGLVATADLRRARWFSGSADERLLLLLLLARLRRGQGCVLESRLRDDLGALAQAAFATFLPEPQSAELAAVLRSDDPALRVLLDDAITAAGTPRVDRPLVRIDTLPAGRVVSFSRSRDDEARLVDGIRRRLSASRLASGPCGLPDIPQVARLHPLQRAAAEKALRHRTLVVAGGPGTGKTSVAAGILASLAAVDPAWKPDSVMLCAPTGRAKARLAESIREQIPGAEPPSRTLHSLLGMRPDGSCRHDADHPLPWSCVVLDEASMVDQALFTALVDALHPESRLLVLGDPEQLPSVEAGAVFGDLVAHLDRLDPEADPPFVRLTHTWRSSGAILDLAREVNQGTVRLARSLAQDATSPAAPGLANGVGDVRWVSGSLPDVLESWWSRHQVPGATPASSRILCATHGGPSGREAINAHGADWQLRHGIGAAGSPAILTRNIPSLDLWNGDLAVLSESDGRSWADFPRDGGRVSHPVSRLEGLEPAWAITIHKSQGSEFDHVLLVLPDRDSPLLTRQILYTGLTRARRSLWIWGDPDLWEAGVLRREDRGSPLFRI